MAKMIAFLRAINVGGRNVKMTELCELFESLRLSNVESFIASGNIIFDTRSRSTKTLTRKIESGLAKALGYEVDTFLRTADEVCAIVEHPAFPAKVLATAGALGVGLIVETLNPAAVQKIMSLKTAIDDFHVHDREVYWLCKKKQSESKFTNAMFEKTLGTRATFRTIKTYQRLAAKYGSATS